MIAGLHLKEDWIAGPELERQFLQRRCHMQGHERLSTDRATCRGQAAERGYALR